MCSLYTVFSPICKNERVKGMKKFISLVLVFVMAVSCTGVFADSNSAQAMEKVLVSVKSKIDVPADLTEFNPYSGEHNGKVSYNFSWSDAKNTQSLDITCDGEGRINSYYYYHDAMRNSQKITSLTKADIISFVDSFVKKAMPEAFRTDDILVFDEQSWDVTNNTNYSLTYKRAKNGVEVKDNYAYVTVAVLDELPCIRRLSVNYNYDAEFEQPAKEIEDYTNAYMEAFPLELIYRDKYVYQPKNDEDSKNETVLVYRHKDNEVGYILASDGEVVTEDLPEEDEYIFSTGAGMESANDSMLKGELTEKELQELEKIDGLVSKEDAEKVLKKLPYVKLDNNMEFNGYNLDVRDGKYYLTVNYKSKQKDGQRSISAEFDAKTCKLLNLYNRTTFSETAELKDAQKKSVNTAVDKFLKAVAPDEYECCKEYDESVYGTKVTKNFDRQVNGIRYIDDGISVQYDVKSGMVTNYRLDYDEEKIFAGNTNVISPYMAYKCLLGEAPLKKVYLKTGGTYKQCYTLSRLGVQVDAFTGEEYKENYGTTENEYNYTDIRGHWAEEKIKKLAEVQIGLEGDKFYPDAPISQYDLLRLFAAGIRGKSYLNYDEENFYYAIVYEGILSETERNPKAQVLREDAFVYMVRFDGLEKVAKLSNIFKVEYADGHLLTEGKIGYPAILTGMNIICGDGGYLRPKDAITRAEAATMLYNFLTNK